MNSLDRCAAYVAARGALEAIRHASSTWPSELSEQARLAAIETMVLTADSVEHDHGSPGRRRCVRAALATAIDLAATCDIARALGLDDEDLQQALRLAGRSVAQLAMYFHANAGARVGE